MDLIVKEVIGCEFERDLECWIDSGDMSLIQTDKAKLYFKLNSVNYSEVLELANKLAGNWIVGTSSDWNWIETEKFPF